MALDYEKLKEVALEIIEKEKLPTPIIKFRHPIDGVKQRRGVCICNKNRLTNERKNFKLIISTIKAEFAENPKGKYINKDKIRVSRTLGKQIDDDEIINTLAHEIAHMKYHWHRDDHKNYTEELNRKLLNRKNEFTITTIDIKSELKTEEIKT